LFDRIAEDSGLKWGQCPILGKLLAFHHRVIVVTARLKKAVPAGVGEVVIMLRIVFATLMLAILSALPSVSQAVENGTRVIVSDHGYWALIARLEAAIKRQNLRIVTRASVRGADRQKKLGIPGNMVIGAFGDEYTARILRANVAAGIETPIRFYVTRDADDKTTTLWYRRPSWVLAPYGDKSGDLRAVGAELDRVMETIADEAARTAKRTNRLLVSRESEKPKAAKPAPDKPKARTPERIAKAVPAKAAKAAEKRAEPTPPKMVKAVAALPPKPVPPKPAPPKPAPRKLAAPKPLIPTKREKSATPVAAAKPATPVARAAPRPLTATKASAKTPQQGAKTPIETARRTTESARKDLPPVAKRDPDRDAISLTPLMLQLQGQ
jgi:uncharacterized protein (DUF302 family)